MKSFTLHFLVVLCINCSASAQWSTSTSVGDALYVCPGFWPGFVSLNDGGCIILGALSNSIYAQKLDQFGFAQWFAPILVHNNDSSAIGSGLLPVQLWGGWISDGDGGAILYWFDHRGSTFDQAGYLNSCIYAQRVDKSGTVKWQQGGVLVKGPESGLKTIGGIVEDGQGGCVIGWTDNGSVGMLKKQASNSISVKCC